MEERQRWESPTVIALDSTLRTALASFYVSDTEGIRLLGFCNRDITPTILLSNRQPHPTPSNPMTFIDLPSHHAYHCAIP
jgi:hypothetical protein